jgi:Zn-dependent peptidase ImmA (M78 family)
MADTVRDELPITPQLVSWARKRAGLSVEEATKSFKKIQEWEDGKASPTYAQLEKLADAFKVPVAVFFFPEPPDVPNIAQTFRTLPDVEFDHIPSRIQLLLRKAKALQMNLGDLTGNQNPSPRLITRDLKFEANANLSEAAAQVRAYLGVPLSDQTRWPDDETAIKEWRKALLAAGVFVFKDAFRDSEFSGFCLYDDVFPVIYVNNSTTKTRQIFTLFHELAHLLFHTSGIDKAHDEYISRLRPDGRDIEVFCNRFAAEFLFPERDFSAALADQKPTEATAERLASVYHVSREFIFRRFLDRELIGEATYVAAARRWASQKQTGSGGDYYWTKLSYLGRDYVSLALTAYRRNRISENELAEYLDTKPRNLAGIEDYFARGAA